MTGIVAVIRVTGLNTSHSMGVISALLVLAAGVVLFGGLWIWLSRLATNEHPTPEVSRLTVGPKLSPDASHIPMSVEVEYTDQAGVGREAALTS